MALKELEVLRSLNCSSRTSTGDIYHPLPTCRCDLIANEMNGADKETRAWQVFRTFPDLLKTNRCIQHTALSFGKGALKHMLYLYKEAISLGMFNSCLYPPPLKSPLQISQNTTQMASAECLPPVVWQQTTIIHLSSSRGLPCLSPIGHKAAAEFGRPKLTHLPIPSFQGQFWVHSVEW